MRNKTSEPGQCLQFPQTPPVSYSHLAEVSGRTGEFHFASEMDVRRAIAGYSGLVAAMDENVGYVLRALHDAGLETDTRVIHTSDHGDNVGARGLLGKSTLYEGSAGVPLIVAGPDVPAGHVVDQAPPSR